MIRAMTKGARFGFYVMLFLMGCAFWIATVTGHFTMYGPVYGWVSGHRSEVWAAGMLFPSAIYLTALFINGRRAWTAPMRCAMDMWMIVYFGVFVTSAVPVVGGDLMVIVSGVMMAKAGVMLFFDGLDMVRRWHGGN